VFKKISSAFSTWTKAQRANVAPFPAYHELEERKSVTKHGTIVGFHTNDALYEAEARRMSKSAARLGLDVSLTTYASAGSWVRNASLKAGFLAKMRETIRGPLLYVDVDSVFHRDPWPVLADSDADIEVYFAANGDLLAGTILIADTPAASRLMALWHARCEQNPDVFDQVVLQSILEEDGRSATPQFTVSRLSVSFCWIFDRLNNEPVDMVYIEQLQASRQATARSSWYKRDGKRLRRRRQRINEIDMILASS
jgi:hypothetical protein